MKVSRLDHWYKLGVLLCFPLLVSCAHYSPVYWRYGEWREVVVAGVPDESCVAVAWSRLPGVISSIDGVRLGPGYKKAKLSPGVHTLEYACYTAGFGEHPQGRFEVTLEAGHAYEFGLKLCFWAKPRKYAVWLDDITTGGVVWGRRPDWPSWWL